MWRHGAEQEMRGAPGGHYAQQAHMPGAWILDATAGCLCLMAGAGLCALAKCVRAEICLIELPALLSCAIPCHALSARSWHNFDRPTGALALHQTAQGVRTARVICTENLPEMRT